MIEQWGSGVQRILSSCKEAGLKPPIFEEIGTHFRVTIYLDKVNSLQLDSVNQKILNILKEKEGVSTHEIAQEIKLSSRATRIRLIKLIDLGLVTEIGLNARDPNKKYFRSHQNPG